MSLHTSRSIKSKKSKKLLQYVLFMTVFCIILLFYVYQHIQALRYGYAVEEKRTEESLLKMENDRILMEIKRYTSLPRLEELAKTKLGLKVASQQEIIVMVLPDSEKGTKKRSFFERAIKKFNK